jgi:type II secretory pathway pseudopilin PulG
MAMPKLVLGSAGSLLVAGALVAAAPTLAQSTDYATARAQYDRAQAQYNAQVQEYNEKNRAYQQQRDDYNAKLNNYRSNTTVYDQSRRPPDTAVVVQNPPTVVVQNPPANVVVVEQPDPFVQRLVFANPPVVLWKLDMVADPNRELFNAVVVDAAGLPVGHFRRVENKDPGYDAAVITLNNPGRTISLGVEHIRFDPNAGVIIADLTANEIHSVPSGPFS